jgi:hypothetical protein
MVVLTARQILSDDYLKDFKRLTKPLMEQISETVVAGGAPGVPGYVGGQADLTPLKNKAREAVEALNDAQRAADSGRTEDTLDALRRARAVIDAALGASVGAHGAAIAPMGGPTYGRY